MLTLHTPHHLSSIDAIYLHQSLFRKTSKDEVSDDVVELAISAQGIRCIVDSNKISTEPVTFQGVVAFYLDIRAFEPAKQEGKGFQVVMTEITQLVGRASQANTLMQQLEQDVRRDNRKWKRRRLLEEKKN